jgi:glycerophosphoryl diester phosphodiesterase
MLESKTIIAHRGATALAPENTMAAFEIARRAGITVFEFDVLPTSDDELVVIHDKTVNRTTDGSGNVWEHTLNELQALDAGSWFGNEFLGECIPTLEQVLKFLNEHELKANLELKPTGNAELDIHTATLTAEALADLPDADALLEEKSLVLSSFSYPALKALKKLNPKLTLNYALEVEDWDQDITAHLDDLKDNFEALMPYGIIINQECLTQAHVDTIHKLLCNNILAHTVNDKLRANELFSWGVLAVFSDVLGMTD